MTAPIGGLVFYRPRYNDGTDLTKYNTMYEGDPEDDDDDHLSDKAHHKNATQVGYSPTPTHSRDTWNSVLPDRPEGELASSYRVECGCLVQKTPNFIDPNDFVLRTAYRVSHVCDKYFGKVEKQYAPIPVTTQRMEPVVIPPPPPPETGIPNMEDVNAELPCLQSLIEHAEELADESNVDAIVSALSNIDDPEIASEVRRNFLRDMPPTCHYMVTRRKLAKWQHAVDNFKQTLENIWDDELYYTSYDSPDRAHYIGRKIERARGRIRRYNERLNGPEGSPEKLHPCGKCFSCKANTIGTETFLKAELPVTVSETVNEMKGEILNLI